MTDDAVFPEPWPGRYDNDGRRRFDGDDSTVRRFRPIIAAVVTGRHDNQGTPLDYEVREDYRRAAETTLQYLQSESAGGPLHVIVEFLIATVAWVAHDIAADGIAPAVAPGRFPPAWPSSVTDVALSTGHEINSVRARLTAVIYAIGLRPGSDDSVEGLREDYMNAGESILDLLEHEVPNGPRHADVALLIWTVDYVAHDISASNDHATAQ